MINQFDRAILRILQKEGRISNVELAERVNLSESACLRRVRVLEKIGFIKGYAAVLDQQKLGLPGNVYVNITLEHSDMADLSAFEEAIQGMPEVMECYLMTGEYDYLLRLVVSNVDDFERIHRQHLTRLPGVARLNSSFTLRTVRKTGQLPID
jgi:DNA-binding Lrp family transcriptional regulator